MNPVHHSNETSSNTTREDLARLEPLSLRTYTPTQAVLAKSAGSFLWTPEGRRLFDFTSGVLVTNLGHNPQRWMKRFQKLLGWDSAWTADDPKPDSYYEAVPMTAYNAATDVEIEASRRLVKLLQERPGGSRMEQVFWAASGSEAIQKALWCALARDDTRDMIVATRHGFHGKKGLAGAVTGCETDHDRDPRVRFISFPQDECTDVSKRGDDFDPMPYRRELDALYNQFGRHLTALITEPYLGGGGSFHPPKAYLQMLQDFCREKDLVFILDEVQANFGRTGNLFAYETYGIEPDIVVLGKGLGNGVPVAAAVGRADIFSSLTYGEGSDTWSANPICCAAVIATLDEFEKTDVMSHCRKVSTIIEKGLVRLKEFPFVAHVRGEEGGMVWGLDMAEHANRIAHQWANDVVLACYQGDANGNGVHLLGPLSRTVIRIAPPLTITEAEANEAMELMYQLLRPLATAK